MEFFGKVGVKAKEVAAVAGEKAQVVAAVVGEKAGDAAARAKLEYAIAVEKFSLNKNYTALGEWFAANVGEDVPEEIADIVATVRASQEKLAEYTAQRSGKNTERVCPACGKMSSTAFCPDCGAKME